MTARTAPGSFDIRDTRACGEDLESRGGGMQLSEEGCVAGGEARGGGGEERGLGGGRSVSRLASMWIGEYADWRVGGLASRWSAIQVARKLGSLLLAPREGRRE